MSNDRERTRTREPEPEPTETYDKILEDLKQTRERVNLPHVVKAAEIPWQIGRNGKSKYYSTPYMDQAVLPNWDVFRKTIEDKNGRHTHQGGLVIFALHGEGETLCDDERIPWEAGDLIVLPIKPGGIEHQHFNRRGPDDPAEWVAFVDIPMLKDLGGQLTQNEVYREWQEKHAHILDAHTEDYTADYDEVSELFFDFDFDEWLDYEPPEEVETYYDGLVVDRNKYRKMVAKAREAGNWVKIDADQPEWELNPQGRMKWYLHPWMEDRPIQSMLFAVQEIPPGSRSGRQHRQGGQVHYIMEGEGYTELQGPRYDGVTRFDWEAKDYLGIPVSPEGVTIQHFNANPEKPATFVVAESTRYFSLGYDMGSGFKQLENCPEYDAQVAV